MKKMKITGALLLALVVATGVKAQSESLTVPLSEPGKPYKLNVHLVNGGIKIVGYEGKDIVVEAQIGSEGRRKNRDKDGPNVNVNVNINGSGNTGSSGGMKRIAGAGGGLELNASERNNKVTVETDSWKHTVDLVIKVPASGGELKLGATNNGDISVSNVNAELEVENVNGAITLTNISGSALANTVNGEIVAVFRTVNEKTPMAFTTLNGKVDVTLPAMTKANLKAQSERGEVYSDFDVVVDKSAPKVNRSNEKGMYRLNIEDWIYGKINGGGPEMLMKVMNGNIYVRKAK